MKPNLLTSLGGVSLWLAASCGLTAQNAPENGSFELPEIQGKVSSSEGGDPSKAEKTGWARIEAKDDTGGGKMTLGITNTIARSGKQSLYVDFEKLTGSPDIALETKVLPAKAETSYLASIWGRIDFDRPLALDERRPSVWTDIEFLQADQTTDAAAPQTSVRLIPGNVETGLELFFAADKWTQLGTWFITPPGTGYVRITWSWVVAKDDGETDGVIYWDDAELVPFTPPASNEQPAESSAAPSPDTK